MAELFDRDVKTIGKYINNALKEETELPTVAKFAAVQLEGDSEVDNCYYELFRMMAGSDYL